jgi:hypothetical protein
MIAQPIVAIHAWWQCFPGGSDTPLLSPAKTDTRTIPPSTSTTRSILCEAAPGKTRRRSRCPPSMSTGQIIWRGLRSALRCRLLSASGRSITPIIEAYHASRRPLGNGTCRIGRVATMCGWQCSEGDDAQPNRPGGLCGSGILGRRWLMLMTTEVRFVVDGGDMNGKHAPSDTPMPGNASPILCCFVSRLGCAGGCVQASWSSPCRSWRG